LVRLHFSVEPLGEHLFLYFLQPVEAAGIPWFISSFLYHQSQHRQVTSLSHWCLSDSGSIVMFPFDHVIWLSTCRYYRVTSLSQIPQFKHFFRICLSCKINSHRFWQFKCGHFWSTIILLCTIMSSNLSQFHYSQKQLR
jgi:hypothetical protein